jgi:mxaJ protein
MSQVAGAAKASDVLRVCADPNNMPFSNAREEGFENRIAQMAASALGKRLEYLWWAQRRGFFRSTLNAGRCDLIVGVPAQFEQALTTVPYYRSTYVFVSRRSEPRPIGLDDHRLRQITIGVHLIGDDFANTPPGDALARRGIVTNVRGYSLYGDYSQPDPPAALVRAVASRAVDVAIVWGPLAGYFAQHASTPLTLTPIPPDPAMPSIPFAFDIAMGVRRGDIALKQSIDSVITRHRREIDAVLAKYGVPRVDKTPAAFVEAEAAAAEANAAARRQRGAHP